MGQSFDKYEWKLLGDVDDNTIRGERHNEIIKGLRGDDRLVGGAGKDMLVGGEGNDVLTGDSSKSGAFADEFFFYHRDGGRDIITDFDAGQDTLVIFKGAGGVTNVSDFLDHAHAQGNDVVLELGDLKITLQNVDLDELKAGDFDFV